MIDFKRRTLPRSKKNKKKYKKGIDKIVRVWYYNIISRKARGQTMTRKELAYKIAMIEADKHGTGIAGAKRIFNGLMKGCGACKPSTKEELEIWYSRIR